MLVLPVPRVVRVSLLALVVAVLAPFAAAEPAQTIRSCGSNHCVIVQDKDADGRYEWANAAFIVGEQLMVGLHANNTTALWQADATNDELVETPVHTVLVVSLVGGANLTGPSGGPGFNETDALVLVAFFDHETGEQDPVLLQYLRVYDEDEDEVPDSIETLP